MFLALNAQATPVTRGLQLWLDASDATTITAGGTGLVSQWRDKSVNARHANMATASVQPITGNYNQNDLNILEFYADYMQVSGSAFSTTEMFFAYRTAYPYYLTTGCVLCRANGSYPQTYITSTSTTFLQAPNPTEVIKDGNIVGAPNFDASPISDFHVLMIHPSDDTSTRLYEINDRDGTRDRYLIGEILAYNGSLTSVERLQINNYLSNKWGTPYLAHTKSPAPSEQSVGLTENLELSFVETIFIDNGNVEIRRMSDDSLFESIDLAGAQVSGSGTSVITINPSGSFANDTEYYVQFPGGKLNGMVTGKQFASLQDRYLWHFKTVRAAPEDFNPRHLDGLELWLDASDAATLTTSGDRVTNWADKSGNERDAVQTNNTYRPQTGIVDIFGQAALYFIDRYMDLNNDFFKSGTTFQVFRNERTYFYNRDGAILGEASATFQPNYVFDVNQTYFNAPYASSVMKNTSTITPIPYDLDSTDDWMILTVDTPAITQKPQDISTRWGTSYRSQNQIAEVISYNRYLTTTEKRQVIAYLQKKWRIGGIDHTKSPLDGDVDVPITDSLTLTFSETADVIGTDNVVIRDTTNGNVFETIAMNSGAVTGNGTTTITINPSSNFQQGIIYQVEFPGAQIQGETTGYYFVGTPSAADWTFRTVDPGDTTFDPTDIAGCQIWLDADDASTLTFTTGRLSNWADKSGSGHHAFQTNNTYRPDSGLVTLNGRNTLRFYDDYMNVVNGGDFATETIIQVFRNTFTYFMNRDSAIVGSANSYQSDTYAFDAYTTYFLNAPYPQRVQKNSVEIVTPNFDLNFTDEWMVLTVEQAFPGSSRDLVIGSRRGTGGRAYNMIAEVVVYDRKLTATELQQVTNYLQNKWGIGGLEKTLYPEPGQTSVGTTDNLTMTFSETVDVVNGDLVIHNLSTGAIHEIIDMTTAQVTGNGTTTITINPSVNFATDTDYAVEVPSGKITGESSGIDFAGSQVGQKYSWKFRTTDTDPNFFPHDINGLQLWLDAADTSSLTLSTNNVTDWSDKSNMGRNASQTNSTYQGYINTVFKNNYDVIRMYDDWMEVNGEPFTAATIIQVFDTPYPYFYNRSGAILGRKTTPFTASYRVQANQPYFNNGPYPDSVRKDYAVVTGGSFDLSPMGEWMVLTVTPTDKINTRDYVVNSMDFGGNRFYNDIAEIIVYDRELSTQELVQIHNYLNQKWHIGGVQATLDPPDGAIDVALTANLTMSFAENIDLISGEFFVRRLSDGSLVDNIDVLTANVTGNGTSTITVDLPAPLAGATDYYVELDQGAILGTAEGLLHIGFNTNTEWNFRTINAGPFSPLDVQGIQLWYDAADTGTITATGSKVTDWADKSGYNRDAYQTNASYRCDTGLYTQNGLNVLYCDRGFHFITNGTFMTGDVYTVYRSHENYFYLDGSTLGRANPDLSETFLFDNRTKTFNNPFPKELSYSNKPLTQLELTSQGGVRHMREWKNFMQHPDQDGIVRDHIQGARAGGYGSDGRYDIAEIIAYDNEVSPSNKLTLFKYLADKWHVGGPEIVSTNPAVDAVDVSTSSNIQISFDEPVDLVSGNLVVRRLSDDVAVQTLPLSGATGNGTSTITFSPAAFASDEEFYLDLAFGQIRSEADDFAFVGFDDSDDFNFRTTDTDPNFSPEDISNLKVWLDANDPSGLTLDGNGFLQRWIDKSGHGNDFTQLTTPAQRPNILNNRVNFNNKTVVSFDDSNDGMRSDYDLRYPYTVFMIMSPETRPQGGSRLLQGRDISWIMGYYNNRFVFYNENWVNYDAADTATTNAAVLLSALTNVTGSEFYVNGNLQVQNSSYVSSPGFLHMGYGGLTNEPAGNYLGELLVYDRDLTVTEREQVEAYLTLKWGLDLPIDAISFTPPDDSSGFSVNGDLLVEFNKDFDIQFGNLDIFYQNGTLFESIDLQGAQITGNGTRLMTIDPTNNLNPLTSFYVNITSNGITDFSATAYPGIQDSTSWNFVTASDTGKFSPRQIPGLELWLDAADNGTLYIDGSGNVSRWDDKSDNARFALQTTAGLRPRANRIKRNGFRSLEFRFDYLDLNESDFAAEDIYHVYRSITPTYADYGSVLGSTSTSAALRPYLFQSGNTYIHTNPNPTEVFVDNVPLAYPNYHEPIDELKTMLIRPRYPYDASRAYRIGASGSYDAPVEIADVVVYNRQLTDPEKTQLHDYFTAKWFGAEFTPVDDATNIAVADNLIITFNNNVDILTGNLRILEMETDALFESIDLNSGLVTGNGGKLITINPAGVLATDTSYYVEVDSLAFENLDHEIVYEDLGGKRWWNFRTINTTGDFDPRDIQGIELWFDAADVPTITEASDLISLWEDKSGYSRDAVQATASRQPSYNQVQLNGLNVVRSYSDWLDISDNQFPAREVFAVKRQVTPTYNTYGAVLGRQSAGYRTYLYYSGQNYFYPDRYPDRVFKDGTELTTIPFAYSNLDEFYIEDLQIDFPYDPDRYYRLLSSATYGLSQEVGEFIAYNRDLSNAERDAVYTYLFNKWLGIRPISFDPPDNSSNVVIGDNLDILFASSVNIRSGDLRLFNSNGDLIQTVDLNSAAVTGNGTALISVDLPVDMSSDTDYYVEIDRDSINDLNGDMFLGILDNTTWSFRTENTGAFDPRDIGGLQLWLDAQDATTISADGAGLVDTWLDKSGQNRDATMTNNTYKPLTNVRDLNSFNTLYFRDDYMDLANNTFVAGDIFVVERALNNHWYRYSGVIGPTSGVAGYHHRTGYYRTDFNTPYPATVWKDSRVVSGSSKDLQEINDYMVLMIEPSSIASREYYLNREPSHRGWREYGEILVYDRTLTEDERIQVLNYINDKWRLPGTKIQTYGPRDDETNVAIARNLTINFDNSVDIQNGDITIHNLTTDSTHEVIDINSAQVTGNGTSIITIDPSIDFNSDSHYCVFADNGMFLDTEGFEFGGIGSEKEWNFYTINSTSNANPMDVQGLELWIDAADLGTITPAAGSNISRIEDKTGFGHFAYQDTATAQPQTGLITQNNLNVLNFPGGDYLTVDNGFKLKAATIFELFRSKTPDFNTSYSIVGTSDGSVRTYYFRTNEKTYDFAYTPDSVYKNNYLKVTPLFDLEEIDQFMQVEVQPRLEQRVHYRIGARETTSGQSEIGEVLIYNRDLSDAERDTVSIYLQNKWYVGGPEVVSLDPIDGAIDVSQTTNLTISFDENVFIGNGDLLIRNLGDDSIFETIDINSLLVTGNGTNSITINPSLVLNNGDSYYVEIGEYAILNDIGIGMKGFSGNSRWNFIVEEPSDITFDCRDVPGLIHWLDAADNGSITYAAGSLVSQWDDKSGYDRHASQANATYQPDHAAVSLNGLRTLRFTGDSFDTVSNGTYQAVDIYQVYKSPTPTFSNWGQALSNPTGTIGYDYRFQAATSYFGNTPYPGLYIKNYNAMASYDLAPIDEFHAILTNAPAITDRPHAVNNSAGTRINLDIAEICVFDRTLNGSEQQSIFRYFNHKWDVSGPEPITLTPPDNGTSASLTADLVMQFNRPINIQNGFINIYQGANGNLFEQIDVQGGQVTGNGSVSISINPTLNFTKDTDYYVRIDKTAFDDVYNMHYFGILDNGWSFRTVNSGWLDSDWLDRIEITVSAASINSDLRDFPVYLDLSTLPASFFAAVNAEGKDIRITTQDGLNELPREVVFVNTGSSTGEVYFKAPFLSSTNDTIFYLYYGNPNGVEPNPANEVGSHNVWTNGYAAVYHMQEDPGEIGALVFDSTASKNHLNVFGSMTPADSVGGYFGNAIDFDGGDDRLVSRNAINTSGEFSISAWVRPNALAGTRDMLSMINGNSLTFSLGATGAVSQSYGDGASFGTASTSAAGIVSAGNWSHVAVSRNVGGTNVLSSNGNTLNTQTNTSDTTGRLVVGSQAGASNFLNGRLDEIRLSNKTRSNDWLRAEYQNLANPNTFYTDGTPEPLAAFLGPIILETYPRNKAKRVPIRTDLRMTFNQAVNVNVGFLRIRRYSDDSMFRLINLTGGSITGSGSSVINIDPGTNFEPGVDYYVEIDIGGFEDLSGNRFVGIFEKETWIFRAEGGVNSEVDSDFNPN